MKKINFKTIINKAFLFVKNDSKKLTQVNYNKNHLIINDSFLVEIRKYIINNVSKEKITVKEIAEKFNLSERTILRRIKDKTGLTTVTFINHCKLEHSLSLIKEEKNLSIAEITYCLGYNTPSYFSKCFKEKYKLTPIQFKKKASL